MKLAEHLEFELETPQDLDLELTLNSSQAFQWVRVGERWIGAVDGSIVALRSEGSRLVFEVYGAGLGESLLLDYFRLRDDVNTIVSRLSFDPLVTAAAKRFPGLRLLKQPPWECTLMFICSTNNNWKRISKMILNLNAMFGDSVDTPYGSCRTFPSAARLSAASIRDLKKCGLGYRAPMLREAARMVHSGEVDLDSLRRLGYSEAVKGLQRLPGVGPKVADCVALLSLGKLESFPVDKWIRRIVADHYYWALEPRDAQVLKDEKRSVSPSVYVRVGNAMRSLFGEYSGYAQNYLYCYASRSPGRLLKVQRRIRAAPHGGDHKSAETSGSGSWKATGEL
ncbi:MAG: DNA glycosylase [Thermoprotei archaeon]